MRWLGELLHLRRDEPRRVWPFFAFYLLLFGAFTLADGLSVALFVEQVGVWALPVCYGCIAVANLVLIASYVLVAERVGSHAAFQMILGGTAAAFAGAWGVLRFAEGGPLWYGLLYVTREVGFTLVLMHFGTYLQDFFTRDELNRVLAIVYAGGHVGGVVAGWLLEQLSGSLGPLDTVPVFLGLCLVCMGVLPALSRWAPRPTNEQSQATPESPQVEEQAANSLAGFLRFVWVSPMLFWLTVVSVLFMVVRWLLNYQYSRIFEGHFEGSAALAAFLGRYSQVALLLSLLVQLLVVNRLVARLGIGGTHLTYAALVCLAAGLGSLSSALAVGVTLRLLETELRYGVRNPLMQLMSNQFSRPMRLHVRAWTMGLLTPVGTAAASVLLAVAGGTSAVGWFATIAGLAFLGSAWMLVLTFPEGRVASSIANKGFLTEKSANEPR